MARKIGTGNHCGRWTSVPIGLVHIWVLHLEGFPCKTSCSIKLNEKTTTCVYPSHTDTDINLQQCSLSWEDGTSQLVGCSTFDIFPLCSAMNGSANHSFSSPAIKNYKMLFLWGKSIRNGLNNQTNGKPKRKIMEKRRPVKIFLQIGHKGYIHTKVNIARKKIVPAI